MDVDKKMMFRKAFEEWLVEHPEELESLRTAYLSLQQARGLRALHPLSPEQSIKAHAALR